MKRYENYKRTKAKWIVEIPDNWSLNRIKYCASLNDDVISETTDEGEEILYVEISSVQGGKIISKEKYKFGSAPSRARRKVKPGDVIVSTVRTYLKAIARIEAPEDNLVVSTGFAVVRPKAIQSQFLGYLFNSERLIGEIISRSVGVSYPAINSSEIGDIVIPVPPQEEQTAIANYLDKRTAHIDTLIEKKRKLIELLKEERRAIINKAVSGEGKNWERKKLKYVAKMQSGFAFSSDDFVPEGVQLIKISNLYQNEFSLDRQPTFLPEVFAIEYKEWLVGAGDILMSMTGTLGKRDYGYAIQVTDTDKNFLLNQRVSKITFDKNQLIPEFGLHILRSDYFLDQLFLMPSGTKQGNFSNEQVLSLSVIYPRELRDQLKVMGQLRDELARIDQMISQVQRELDLILEYKVALVNEVVTGKVKVI